MGLLLRSLLKKQHINADALPKYRYERKYILSLEAVPQLIREISPFTLPDRYTDTHSFKYPISSLYFDTSDYLFYEEKMNGEYDRRKLRIRQYKDSFDISNPIFLEIKGKQGDFVLKKRAAFSYHDLVRIWKEDFDRKTLSLFSAAQQEIIEETKFLLYTLNLQSKLFVNYNRYAVVSKTSPSVRFTIDTNITYASHFDFPFISSFLPFSGHLGLTMAIVEIKSKGEFPSWISHIIQRFDLNLYALSKYCLCLKEARNSKDWGLR